QDATVIPDFDASIGPPIEPMTCVAPIVECGPLFEVIAPGTQRELNTPLHAISTVNIADPYRGATIGFACHGEIDGRNRHPIVRNRKVEFNLQRRPHAAVGKAGKLYGGVGIKHRNAIDFVDTGIEMASEIGQNGAFKIFVFQIKSSPFPRYTAIDQIVAE